MLGLEAAGPLGVRVVDADDLELGLDTAIPCALIINELVSNSLKYAFPNGRAGEIRLRRGTLGETRLTPQGYFHAELRGREYPNLHPELVTDEIGTHVWLLDPFGNTLRFNQRP